MATRDAGSDYARWKGWNEAFTFSAVDAAYFAGECKGLAIAGAAVFEIGFGTGRFIAWAQQHGAAVVGCEADATLARAAHARGLELLPADFETVATEHRTRFDTVAAFDVFEHFSLEEIATRLRALETMIRPGGHLLLRFPNGQSPFGLALQNGDPTHKTALSRNVFELLIQPLGFEVARYGPAYQVRGRGPLRRIAQSAGQILRALIQRLLNRLYRLDICYEPMVVIVLRRR